VFASDLAAVGGGLDNSRLALPGIITAGAVLPTVRRAAGADYEITVVSDACADPEPDVCQFLLERVFPVQAEVSPVREWA
jgi:nicotinamidase-related amidase